MLILCKCQKYLPGKWGVYKNQKPLQTQSEPLSISKGKTFHKHNIFFQSRYLEPGEHLWDSAEPCNYTRISNPHHDMLCWEKLYMARKTMYKQVGPTSDF